MLRTERANSSAPSRSCTYSASRPRPLLPVQSQQSRQDTEAPPRPALRLRQELRPFRPQLLPEAHSQNLRDRCQRFAQPWLVHDQWVQFAEVEIGAVLDGRVADRDPLACHATRQAMIHDAVQEGGQRPIRELASVQALEQLWTIVRSTA